MHALRMPYFMTLTDIELSLAQYQKLFMTCLVATMHELTLNSKAPTPIPAAAPEPARPIKCSLPMLLANNDAPTYGI